MGSLQKSLLAPEGALQEGNTANPCPKSSAQVSLEGSYLKKAYGTSLFFTNTQP